MNSQVDFFGLYGEKVALASFTVSDISSTYLGWLNDPYVTQFSNQRFILHDFASSLAYLETFSATDNLFVSIRDRDTGDAIGTMTAYINSHHETADIGLLIGPSSLWGKGYGQDAWRTLGDWLLNVMEIRKITAGTVACNKGMIHIMRRYGMHYEGARYKQELIDGVPHDLVYYAKFRDL